MPSLHPESPPVSCAEFDSNSNCRQMLSFAWHSRSLCLWRRAAYSGGYHTSWFPSVFESIDYCLSIVCRNSYDWCRNLLSWNLDLEWMARTPWDTSSSWSLITDAVRRNLSMSLSTGLHQMPWATLFRAPLDRVLCCRSLWYTASWREFASVRKGSKISWSASNSAPCTYLKALGSCMFQSNYTMQKCTSNLSTSSQ